MNEQHDKRIQQQLKHLIKFQKVRYTFFRFACFYKK